MGLRAFEPVQKIDNVAPGATFTVNLPIGNTYDVLLLELAGDLTKAHISNLKLELDGRLVSDWRLVADLEGIDAYYGRRITANIIAIQFNQDDVTKTVEEGRLFGLGTYGLTTAVISGDISTTPTNPVLKAFAEKSAAARPGVLKKFRRYPVSVAAGVNEITNIPRPAGAAIAAIHVKKADATKAELIVDNKSWFNFSKAMAEESQRRYGRAPQANHLHLDMMLQGDMFQTLSFPNAAQLQKGAPAVQDMRLRVECTTGGNLDVIVEYIDEWNPNGF